MKAIPLRIGTRESPLALWQAEHVRAALAARYPDLAIDIVKMKTSGDRFLQTPLAEIGGKGLFVKEIEDALLAGRVDLAVHSMKDVPAEQPEGLEIAAIMAREDPRDAFVSRGHERLEDLPALARVGSSSLRRRAQLLARHPQLEILDLRGNVGSRLRKLDEGQFDAVILAAAGLKRLGLAARIRATLPPEVSLPAVGQGAIGIETRTEDGTVQSLIAPLNDARTSCCVRAERAMNALLGGGCRLPVAGFAEYRDHGRIWLRGLVADPQGREVLRAEWEGAEEAPEAIGAEVARRLLGQGADRIIGNIYGGS